MKVAVKELSIGDRVRYTIKEDNGAYRSLAWTVTDKHITEGNAKLRLERPGTWIELTIYKETMMTVTKSTRV